MGESVRGSVSNDGECRPCVVTGRRLHHNRHRSRFLQVLPAAEQQLQEHPLGFELVFGHGLAYTSSVVFRFWCRSISCTSFGSTFILTRTEASVLRKV